MKFSYDKDGRPVDALGRKWPRRMDAVLFHRALPGTIESLGFLAQFSRVVPDEFWSLDEVDGEPAAVLACPCGETPVCRAGSTVGCECERSYLFSGTEVRVANSPKASVTR